jgi:tetratricopeptide (TPR) repeat protein
VYRVRGIMAWRRAAWRFERQGFQRVVSELERARVAAQGKADFTTQYLLGFAYMRLGRVSEADTVLRDARQMAPDFPGFLLTDSMRIATEDRTRAGVERALRPLQVFALVLPTYLAQDRAFSAELTYLGCALRGRLYSRMGRYHDQAVKDLERALAVSEQNRVPLSAEVVALLAQTHQSLDQSAEAERIVKLAISRDPAEASHYFNMGLICAAQQHEKDARRWFEAALARRESLADAHLKLAYLAMKEGEVRDLPRIRAHLEAFAAQQEQRTTEGGVAPDTRALADLEAGYGDYWKLVADARLTSGDESGATLALREAQRHYRLALEHQPGCVVALNRLIQLGSRLGSAPAEIEEIKKRLEKVNEQEPGGVEIYRSTFC